MVSQTLYSSVMLHPSWFQSRYLHCQKKSHVSNTSNLKCLMPSLMNIQNFIVTYQAGTLALCDGQTDIISFRSCHYQARKLISI